MKHYRSLESADFFWRELARAAKQKHIFLTHRGLWEVILQSPAVHLWGLIQEGSGTLTHFWLQGNCRDLSVFWGGSRTWQRLCLSWPRGPFSSTPFRHLITHAEALLERLGYLSEHTGTSVFNPLPRRCPGSRGMPQNHEQGQTACTGTSQPPFHSGLPQNQMWRRLSWGTCTCTCTCVGRSRPDHLHGWASGGVWCTGQLRGSETGGHLFN